MLRRLRAEDNCFAETPGASRGSRIPVPEGLAALLYRPTSIRRGMIVEPQWKRSVASCGPTTGK